ncbi:uncharacterized protein TNCV_1625701 [Trichonephila clavipes]|nr:uncharacterized protein TNCV_1625701 [Trichonephila clavipes]
MGCPTRYPKSFQIWSIGDKSGDRAGQGKVGTESSTRNGRRDPKCPSARHLCLGPEDALGPSEGATCVWMAVNEVVGCTPAFYTMGWSSRRLVCRMCSEPGHRVNDISRIHWSQQILTTQSEQPNS